MSSSPLLQLGRRLLGRFPTVRYRDERGTITPAIAVFAVSVLAAAGLAVDGGRKLNGLAEARDLADNAARVGAQQVDVDAYRLSGIPTLDAGAAAPRPTPTCRRQETPDPSRWPATPSPSP